MNYSYSGISPGKTPGDDMYTSDSHYIPLFAKMLINNFFLIDKCEMLVVITFDQCTTNEFFMYGIIATVMMLEGSIYSELVNYAVYL